MIERHVERFAPILVAVVALLTTGAWLAAHGGIGASPGPHRPPHPQFPQQPPQEPQYPPPPPQQPAPKSSGCADCSDIADCGEGCADCATGCDVSDCDISGCDCDCSGIDCTLARASTRSMSWLVLLLPLALLDAWRRKTLRT